MARTLAAEPLTPAAFEPFGRVVSGERVDVAPTPANGGTALRFDRLVSAENRRPASATLNVCLFRCAAQTSRRVLVEILERHPASPQIFVPMNATRYLVVVAPPGSGAPEVGTLRAFVATGRQGVAYAPGTWHHPILALREKTKELEETDFACLVWEDGSSRDTEVVSLEQGGVVVTLALA